MTLKCELDQGVEDYTSFDLGKDEHRRIGGFSLMGWSEGKGGLITRLSPAHYEQVGKGKRVALQIETPQGEQVICQITGC